MSTSAHPFFFLLLLQWFISVDLWKKKWRTQRDTYVRKKRDLRHKSGQAAIRIKKWRFMEVLSFLDPYLEDAE